MNNSTYEFFQDVHLWPLNSDFNYKRWLENFEDGDDRDIARIILDGFVYIPDSHIEQLFKTVIGKCGYYFMKADPNWTHDSFYNNCIYSFVPGSRISAADSGFIFGRMLREVLHIHEGKVVDTSALMRLLISSKEPINVVLVDDFVGSGEQCGEAWNEFGVNQYGLTLSDIVEEKHHRVIYAPLIVNYIGKQRIIENCKGLHIEYIHLLGKEYCLFEKNSIFWRNNDSLYAKWIDLHQRISKQEGFENTNGIAADDERGYRQQGLAIAFKHGIPDACPPLFHSESDIWKPIIKRHYHYGCKR